MPTPRLRPIPQRVRFAALALVSAAVLQACPVDAGQHRQPYRDACAAARAEVPNLPSDEALEASGAVVGTVSFRTVDIFDTSIPAEDTRLFRLANRLHRTTRPGVIESQLLARTGDRYSRRRLDESERILRANDYLFEARICPVAYDGKNVDLEVTTRDVWTLKLGASFGRGGGTNTFKFVVADNNLLGTGKSLTAERLADVDRTSLLLRYVDPAVAGTRWTAGGSYAHNSDGGRRWLFGELPFFALDSRHAYGIDLTDGDRIDALYDRSVIRRRFREKLRSATGYVGWSAGLVNGAAWRWSAGYTYDDHQFAPVRPGNRPPPTDARTLSYPWLAAEWVQDAFTTTSNLDQIYRVEDLFLGWRVRGQLGYSDPALGGDFPALVYGVQLEGGRQWDEGRTLLWDATADGRFRSGRAEGMLGQGRVRYYHRDFGEELFFVSLEAAVANRLDAERQLLIGGDSGLRGYPLRYQSGDRRVLLTLEQRVFSSWYPFRLVRVGGAMFFDLGRAWFAGTASPSKEFGWLKDFGAGLRLASSRSGFGNVVHVDAAFPLDRPDAVKRVQFVVSTRATF